MKFYLIRSIAPIYTNMKMFLMLSILIFLVMYSVSASFGTLLGLKPNACIMYTANMQYYCEFERSMGSCNKKLGRMYYGEKVIKVWFYYNRYCRELGFRSRFD